MSELLIATQAALWVLVLLMGLLLAGALRQIGLMQLRLGTDPGALITDAGLDRGTLAPDFEAEDPDSGEVERFSALGSRRRLLVFLTPSCFACQEIVPHLNEVHAIRKPEVDLLVVCSGNLEACRVFKEARGLQPQMLVDESGRIARMYEVSMSPFSYLIGEDGRVRIRGVANDWRSLESLIEEEGTPEPAAGWAAAQPSAHVIGVGSNGVSGVHAGD